MLTVISPAKKLNETTVDLPSTLPLTKPALQTSADALAKISRELSCGDLRDLMKISEPLAQLNKDRFSRYGSDQTLYVAAFMFAGNTYTGLEAKTLDTDALIWAQDHLRILSGLYGLLRPLDTIAPYRLEMGSRLISKRGHDLYAYWGGLLSQELNKAAIATQSKILVNCASQEYFSAVDLPTLKLKVVTPVFLEERDGTTKIVSFYAKKARGAMARYISQGHLTDIDDLRGFTTGGYLFSKERSSDAQFIFIRRAQD